MNKLFVIVMAATVAGGCAGQTLSEQCQGYGFQPATAEFSACLMHADLANRQADATLFSGILAK